MKFGEYIKNERIKRNLSQGKFAKAIGVSRQALSKWELGISEPKIDKLVALSEFLEVSISELIAISKE